MFDKVFLVTYISLNYIASKKVFIKNYKEIGRQVSIVYLLRKMLISPHENKWVSYIHFLSKIIFYNKMDLKLFYFDVAKNFTVDIKLGIAEC